MRSIILKLILSAIYLLFSARCYAQTCTGSLGDAVINETFGSGATSSTVGSMLPAGITNLIYTTATCPGNGEYAIVANTGGCFNGTWFTLGQDHTGNANGYMMLVNANSAPSTFYVQKAEGSKLCPNTNYEFAAWILNILRDEPQTAGFIEPNITFSIEKTDGTVLKTYNTGNIKATTSPEWKQYGTFFTSPSDGSDVIVKLINNAIGNQGNDFILDDITFKPCGPVIETGFGAIGSTAALSICGNTRSNYTLVATQQGYNNPTYQWQVNVNDKGWGDISGATGSSYIQSFNNPAVAAYQYRVAITNGNSTLSSCRTYSQPITLSVKPYAVTNLPAATTICEGQQLQLQTQGGNGYSYQWTGPGGFISTEQNPIVSNNSTSANNGVYSLKVTVNGCPSFASTTITVIPKITVAVSSNVVICEGASAALSVQSTGGTNYKWTPSTGLDHDDQPTVNASPTQTTTYTVTVNNGGCFAQSLPVTVTVLHPPVANAGGNKIVMEGDVVTLNGSTTGDSVSYYWTPADHLDNPNSLTPAASPVDNTTYTLHVMSRYNCGESTSNVFVQVFKTVKIPNTFTPNNDGKNDFWDIYQLDTYPESLLTVFDRYGQKVYQSTGYPKPWDGTYNGSPLPPGTYYYIIDLKNHLPKMAGWVLIVR